MSAKQFTGGNVGKCSPHDLSFLRDVRAVLRGSGFYLWRRARGPRRVHALSKYGRPRAFDQSMPLQFAEYLGLYVRANRTTEAAHRAAMTEGMDYQDCRRLREVAEARAAGRVDAIRELYRSGVLPIRPASPTTFRKLCSLAWQCLRTKF